MGVLNFSNNFRTFLQNNKVILFITGLCFLAAALFLYFFYIPPATDIGPVQPIPFSHRVHAGTKNIQCLFCHPYAGRANFPGIPPVAKCLYCHRYIIAQHPQIQKEHRYFNTATSTPWVKVNYIPEHVLFNHQRHIRKAVECRECHGSVENMDRLPSRQFRMQFCITCHRQRGANIGCWLACHG
jgi:hypothetical protein